MLRLVCIGALLILLSCDRNTNSNLNDGLIEAEVNYSGSIAADGCEWIILVDSLIYSPVNLEEEYKVNQLSVRVQFEIIEEVFVCGWGAEIDKIEIIDIKKK